MFERKIDYFLSIFASISMFEHFRDDWACAEPIILLDRDRRRGQKNGWKGEQRKIQKMHVVR